ncbi:hypothetical protein PR202_ga31339 [Eleusine coracana subsp. coracana]|uniref:Uncharacterized protein n=1 Tax=Eleusine coracana subsp. coracana TaxID=191504 RepID=A0AAV5DRK9_ELECO|nr:hypothetical protein PR202_ga31339 [Eleusine coracana subsp. coracana]
MAVEVMETGEKLPANTNDEVFVNNQGSGKEEALKCLNGTSEMPQEVTHSNVNLPPNQSSKPSTRGGADYPSVEGGELNEAVLDVESSPISLKRRKISVEPTSAEVSPDTVDDNIMELEKVANRIRRLQNFLLSMGSVPSSVGKPSWKLLVEASTKQN